MKLKQLDLSVYLVIGPQDCGPRNICEIVRHAVVGGVSVVQLRDKTGNSLAQVELARALKEITAPAGVPLIINDRVDVALAVDADGVHVGQSDMLAADARRLIGPDKLLGLSVSSEEHLVTDAIAQVDYLGIGACYPTMSKGDADALGMNGFTLLRAKVGQDWPHLPVVGIGGINLMRTPEVIKAGADGVAVISQICQAEDPRAASAQLLQAVQKATP
ncbi:thiamine phosphate synthase [Polycladidibacter stylochi]|uniref:thiamine phosphate synthase n=1 Tax=Polycladidibacter stylochi TaxID=1807766 RepID=UPI00082B0CFA|nr:thiamine phosphate synthase [Pseudovibrio stylochi]